MQCMIAPFACKTGVRLPLLRTEVPAQPAHILLEGSLPPGAGWRLAGADGIPRLEASGWVWSGSGSGDPLLLALTDIAAGPVRLKWQKDGYAVCVITLSDKGSQGLRKDTAGPAVAKRLGEVFPVACLSMYMLADDADALRGLLTNLALIQKYDLVCTAGGTGVSARDITPQATTAVLDYCLPGFGEAMRRQSLASTPNAIISRAVCGVAGRCLILNLPGSLAGATENLEAVLPALRHALAKLGGDSADCGG